MPLGTLSMHTTAGAPKRRIFPSFDPLSSINIHASFTIANDLPTATKPFVCSTANAVASKRNSASLIVASFHTCFSRKSYEKFVKEALPLNTASMQKV